MNSLADFEKSQLFYDFCLADFVFCFSAFVVYFVNYLTYNRKGYSLYILLLTASNAIGNGSLLAKLYHPSEVLFFSLTNYTYLSNLSVIYLYCHQILNLKIRKIDRVFIFFVGAYFIFSLIFLYLLYKTGFGVNSIYFTCQFLRGCIFFFVIRIAYTAIKRGKVNKFLAIVGFFIFLASLVAYNFFIFEDSHLQILTKISGIFIHSVLTVVLFGIIQSDSNRELFRKYEETNSLIEQKNKILEEQKETLENMISNRVKSLKESNSIKSKIFAIVSHDLRSPITELLATISLIENDSSINDITHKLKERAINLYNTLDNLLQWASIQIRETPPIKENIILLESIQQCLYTLKDNIDQKNISVIVQIDSKKTIYFNEHQLQIVLRNIIGNAIKFNHTDGFVRIFQQEDPYYDVFVIQDTGIGISKEELDNIFVLSSDTSQNSITGFGLILCRDLIQMQGLGELKIESVQNYGTKVFLMFNKS